MRIEKQAIENLCEHITLNFPYYIEFYNRELKDISSFNWSYEETIENCLYEYIGIDNAILKKTRKNIREKLIEKRKGVKRRIRRQKDSFYNKVIDKNGKFQGDIEAFFNAYSLQPTILTSIYGMSSYDKYITQLLKDNEEWYTNDRLLIQHPYICFLSKQKIDWYYLELSLDVLDYILDDDNNFISFSGVFAEKLLTDPWFAPVSRTIPKESLDYGNDPQTAEYGVSDNSTMIIRNEKGSIKNIKVKVLDEKDFVILNKILTNIDENFIKTGETEFDLGEIVKAVYKSSNPSKKSYDAVIERLEYIKCVQFKEYKQDTNQTIMYSIFDEVIIDHTSNKVKVRFGNNIVQNFVSSKLTYVNNRSIEQLAQPMSKRLIVILQRERMILYSSNMIYSSLQKNYDYNFFRSKFIFMYKSAKKNWDTIIDSLEELSNSGVIVESYKIKADNSVDIWFKPLSSAEISDAGIYQQTILDLIPQNTEDI